MRPTMKQVKWCIPKAASLLSLSASVWC